MKSVFKPPRTIEETSTLLTAGMISAVEVVEECLARIDEWEPKVHAWVVVDRERALDRARELDRDFAEKKPLGLLHGIPVGIKDIIDVKGLPTAAGAKFWGGGEPAEADAELVANLRRSGAIILGKTVTTPFAWIDPSPTRNPWNLDRTPGGSSSGSAVAVATGMCLGSFGTQTGGSIIRPAAFCGAVGFKPSRERISTTGIVPFAPSLDTPGPFARSVEGVRRLAFAARRPLNVLLSGSFPLSRHYLPGFHPRIARLRGPFDDRVDPTMTRAVDQAADRLENSGAEVTEVELPAHFADFHRAHRVVMAAEAAAEHGARLAEHPDDYPPRITELVIEGRSILASDYIRARSFLRTDKDSRLATSEILDQLGLLTDFNAFLMPAAIGAAPDLSTTGDPIFNSTWTYLDFPAVSLPIDLDSEGMPLAAQLLARTSCDEALLDLAAWCEKALRDQNPRD
jgi:Asp-tRNA(Asn)/Glu-tRNA(Gln) amidotransferase A subunit family amidase